MSKILINPDELISKSHAFGRQTLYLWEHWTSDLLEMLHPLCMLSHQELKQGLDALEHLLQILRLTQPHPILKLFSGKLRKIHEKTIGRYYHYINTYFPIIDLIRKLEKKEIISTFSIGLSRVSADCTSSIFESETMITSDGGDDSSPWKLKLLDSS